MPTKSTYEASVSITSGYVVLAIPLVVKQLTNNIEMNINTGRFIVAFNYRFE